MTQVSDASRSEVVFDRLDATQIPQRESLLGLGNGLIFVRAAAPEAAFGAAAAVDAGKTPYPGLYYAGLYNHARRTIAGETVGITALVRLPDPFGLSFRQESSDCWFGEGSGGLEHYRHRLDLEGGIAEREFVLRDASGRCTRLEETRCVSLAQPELALLRWRVTPLNWSGPVLAAARLQSTTINAKLSRTRDYEGQHLEVTPIAPPSTLGPCAAAIEARTSDGRRSVRIVSSLVVSPDAEPVDLPEPGPGEAIERRVRLEAKAGESFTLERWVSVWADARQSPQTPADQGQERAPPALDEVDAAHGAAACGGVEAQGAVDALVASKGANAVDRIDASAFLAVHREAWQTLWQRVQIQAPDDPGLERSSRFIALQLLQTASPWSAGCDVGLPSRGWQEGYFGHIFWDETFAFPFLSARFPAIAKGLLDYRWRRLDAARKAAGAAGCSGAMYPWRSAVSGEEETPRYQWIPPAHRWKRDDTRLQRHIGAAIAFNLWHHYLVTGDRRLLVERSGVMLVEIARFWASTLSEREDGRASICGVIGPDEYHDRYPGADEPGLHDNAYTNAMAAWTLECAARLPERLAAADWRALRSNAAIAAGEPERWDALSRRLRLPLLDGDVLAQFEGFETLLPVDDDGLASKPEDQREDWWLTARGDDINRYQVTKQADVLMLFYLLGDEGAQTLSERLGYRLAQGWQARTIAYYLERISHESSLSRIVTAGALAATDANESWRHYRQALHTDLDPDSSGSTHEGLHLGAMAGCWDVLQRCYLGLQVEVEGVRLRPRPPPALDEIGLRLSIRGHRLHLHLQGRKLRLRHEGGSEDALPVTFGDDSMTLVNGRTIELGVR